MRRNWSNSSSAVVFIAELELLPGVYFHDVALPTMAVSDPFRSSSTLFVVRLLSLIAIDRTNVDVVLRSWGVRCFGL